MGYLDNGEKSTIPKEVKVGTKSKSATIRIQRYKPREKRPCRTPRKCDRRINICHVNHILSQQEAATWLKTLNFSDQRDTWRDVIGTPHRSRYVSASQGATRGKAISVNASRNRQKIIPRQFISHRTPPFCPVNAERTQLDASG
jgi:hypothetical protein